MDDSNDLFANLDKTPPTPARAPARPADPIAQAAKRCAMKDASDGYDASHIEVLEGLEPVRRRPGMYIGGTDEKALHHLFAEVIDNSMDEAVAGHATFIEVELTADGFLTVTDNGRGIPVDPHPKFKNKSALEVIMTHAACGRQIRLQGLRDLGRPAWRRRFGRQRAVGPPRSRGGARPPALPAELLARHPAEASSNSSAMSTTGAAPRCASIPTRRFSARTPPSSRHGSTGWRAPRPICSAASKSAGPAIRCSSRTRTRPRPRRVPLPGRPQGLSRSASLGDEFQVTREIFAGKSEKQGGHGSVEWAVTWFGGDGFVNSYCNTIPTA